MLHKSFALLLFYLLITNQSFSKVILPALFQSHMILQQKKNVALWGWSAPGAKVTIKPSWTKAITIRAGEDGRWKTNVRMLGAGGGYSLTIADSNSNITLNDVLFGEVWFCSGQSNMDFSLAKGAAWRSGVIDYEKVVSEAKHPDIRFFMVERSTSAVPLKDCKGMWQPCTPETAGKFSAVAYYFAVELQKKLRVPVGIITSTWGGTAIESWTKYKVYQTDPALVSILERAKAAIPNTQDPDSANINSRKPSYLYNAMIAPLIPFTIKGMLWYQGGERRESQYNLPENIPGFH